MKNNKYSFIHYVTNYKVDTELNDRRGQSAFLILMDQKIKVLSHKFTKLIVEMTTKHLLQ